ncbi:MAG: bifunctional phosphopantothenoylcysteine decarboxylase/phosphopantothenate--cysteine ligase CoaBC [Acidimicrobiia bacterium]|nr:bifunctional phosphopantothenoylcysteine decarboxylase/phosphopantothenate--cysteine ligase CoaBC [Acidimicrobiia bacterium]
MAGLAGRRVVLGVTGGIAAYKAVEVCRRLVDDGAHVSVVMTAGALRFVGEATFSTLASEPVHRSLWDIGPAAEPPDGTYSSPIPHTRLGQQADLVLVCPATARLIGTYAAGISNDLLTATLLATRAPVVLCPAMHTEMWEHPAVQDNLALLERRGAHLVSPGEGRLAGGDVGRGRLAEPVDVLDAVRRLLTPPSLAGLRVVVSAGGTREPIDPVRFLSNRSSGKQGYAFAQVAAERGAKVTLVTTVERPVPRDVETVPVETAAQMLEAMRRYADGADVIVMAAAVADFRPSQVAEGKIKKGAGVPVVALERTEDILADLGQRKRAGQVLVGFAAETSELRANASDKLAAKRADLIVANDVSVPEVGFEHDTNAVVVLVRDGREVEVPLRDKRQVAVAVLDVVESLLGPTADRGGDQPKGHGGVDGDSR